MTAYDFNNLRGSIGIEGTGIDSTTKQDIQWRDGTKTPAGTKVHIDFAPKNPSSTLMYVHVGDKVYKTNIIAAHRKYTGFIKPPSGKMLERQSFDCVAKSVTGKRVEPDGYGPDGSPSWLLVMGYI